MGNVLRLPYIIGEQGGGAFLIVYCAVLAIVVGPLLIAELTLGVWGEHHPWARSSGLHPSQVEIRVGGGSPASSAAFLVATCFSPSLV